MSDEFYLQTVRELADAYFTASPMHELSLRFSRVQDRLAQVDRKLNGDSPSRYIVHLLMALLFLNLVEYAQITPKFSTVSYRNFGNNTVDFKQTHDTFCNEEYFPIFCQLLGTPKEFLRWTHLILSIVSLLRLNQIPRLSADGGLVAVDDLHESTIVTARPVLREARLLFYGLLFARLSMTQGRYPDADRTRFQIEACLFLSILLFYADYLDVVKELPKNTADREKWDGLYDQVTKYYLVSRNRFFTTLKMKSPQGSYDSDLVVPLMAFLSPVTALTAQQRIATMFIQPYNATISKNVDIDVMAVLKALNNLDTLRNRLNRWFFRNITSRVQSLHEKAVRYKDKFFKAGEYLALFGTHKYTTSAFATGAVAFTLVFYAPQVIADKVKLAAFAASASLATLLAARTALSINFSDPSLVVPPMRTALLDEVRISVAKGTPYLEWVFSSDGLVDRIDIVTPLPRYPSLKNDEQRRTFTGGASDFELSGDVRELKTKMQSGGHLRNELPKEMQTFIRTRLKLNARGRKQRGGATLEELVDDPEIPTNLNRERLPSSQTDPARFEITDPAAGSGDLTIPLPQEFSDSLQNMFTTDREQPTDAPVEWYDPSVEVTKPGADDTPPEIQLEHTGLPVMSLNELEQLAQQVKTPLPPVVPESSKAVLSTVQLYHPKKTWPSRSRSRVRSRKSKSKSRGRSTSRSRARRRVKKKSGSSRKRGKSRSRSRTRPRRSTRRY